MIIVSAHATAINHGRLASITASAPAPAP
eukprot:COSAG06_NODE_22240_length_730_cov_0.744849_1_plen_28_part_01